MSTFTTFFFECNRTPSGKKMVNRVQVVTASKVQSKVLCVGHFILQDIRPLGRSTRGTHFQVVSKQQEHKLQLKGR